MLFSPDGSILASASLDSTVVLWDAVSSQVRATLAHTEAVWSTKFSPDGSSLVSVSQGEIWLWDVGSGQVQAILEGHTRSVPPMSFSPDGSILAIGINDGTIWLWDMGSGQVQATLKGHATPVWSMEFSPDGSILAIASRDEIQFWDVGNGQKKTTIERLIGWKSCFVFTGWLHSGQYQKGRDLVAGRGDLVVGCGQWPSAGYSGSYGGCLVYGIFTGWLLPSQYR